jgi:hypothetical protein
MKKIIGTFLNENEEDFNVFIKLFEDNGYEVARQSSPFQAAVITEEEPEPDLEIES